MSCMAVATEQPLMRLTRDQGDVEIFDRGGTPTRYHLRLVPRSKDVFVPRTSCDTNFPPPLIEYLLDKYTFPWVCENIARHEDQTYVSGILKRQLFSHFEPSFFEGKRLLDFGCGTGASTLALAAMLPKTEICGIELRQSSIEIANRINEYRGCTNVQFLCSPAGDQLPEGIGLFDFVTLSAVYEHLLPSERKIVLRLIWSALKPGGALFINQTPYRYFPYEHHSTGLWFVNYLPDRVTHWMARHLARVSPAINKSPDWEVHLRGGIRGGTEWGILRNLGPEARRHARILQPRKEVARDRAAYWLACTGSERYRRTKNLVAHAFRITDRLWGTVPSINLEFAIQKVSTQDAGEGRASG